MKLYACALATTLFSVVSASDAYAAESDAEVWTNFRASGSLSGNVLVSFDGTLRLGDGSVSAPAANTGAMIGFQATKSLTLWAGYNYAVSTPNGRRDVIEHRAVQQVQWNMGKIGKGVLSSRTRLETRWVDGRSGTGWRMRQSFRFAHPIGAAKILVVLQSEPFVNLNTTAFGQSAGLEQIRNFVGLNVPIGMGLNVEGGYMNRYVRRNGVQDRMNHIATATAVYRF